MIQSITYCTISECKVHNESDVDELVCSVDITIETEFQVV